LRHLTTFIAALSIVPHLTGQASQIDSGGWVAAEVHARPGSEADRNREPSYVLAVYPPSGSPLTLPLPAALSGDFQVVSFGSTGRVIYIQPRNGGVPEGLAEIDLGPTRLAAVPGSLGLSTVWHLAGPSNGHVYVSAGTRAAGGLWRCGVFDVDTSSASLRPLRVGAYTNCGPGRGMFGEVSPDGRRVLDYQGDRLAVDDLVGGSVIALGSGLSDGAWSPDGRWIAAWGRGRITLVDADNPSRHRDLGRCSGGGARWSPDSKYLLLSKQELRCSVALYFGTLEIVEVSSGKRVTVKSSRCSAGGWFGWVDSRLLR
jgi:hypothetical protein